MIKFIFTIPLLIFVVVYVVQPKTSPNKTEVDNNLEIKIKDILEHNSNDPLTIAFEGLLSRVPELESNYYDAMVHYHYLWLKNHCDPSCDENKVSEKIEFYNKQPIKHTLFNSVIFHKDIIIPYTSQSLRKCLEHSCRNIQGEHEVIYELTYSEKNPELSETINKIILKDRNKFFSKYIDDGLYETADSSDENNIKIYFNKIITIKNYHSSYYHGGAHAYGGTYTKHFNIDKNRLLTFNDVFIKNKMPHLSKIVLDRINQKYSKPVDLLHPIEETVSDISLWNFTDEGVYLYLPPYEEGGWMATHRDFTYEELETFLTPFGKTLKS